MAQSTTKKNCGGCRQAGHSIRTCPRIKPGLRGGGQAKTPNYVALQEDTNGKQDAA